MWSNIIYLTAVICSLVSCEKSVIFEVDTQEGKIVVNCLFGTDEDATATVTESMDPLQYENVITPVTDAEIKLFKNDVYAGTFTGADDVYSLDASLIAAEPLDVFRMEISAPGMESASAETQIPSQITLNSVEITDTTYEEIFYSVIDSLGNVFYYDSIVPFFVFAINFDDPSGTDYYSLEIVYEDAANSTYTCFTTSDPAFVFEGAFNEGEGETTVCEEVEFSDLTFDGESKTIQLSLLQINTEFTTNPKLIFKLRHLSPDYYKFISSSELQSQHTDDPFAEPVIVYSNVENGFGIFAGYSISTVEVEL